MKEIHSIKIKLKPSSEIKTMEDILNREKSIDICFNKVKYELKRKLFEIDMYSRDMHMLKNIFIELESGSIRLADLHALSIKRVNLTEVTIIDITKTKNYFLLYLVDKMSNGDTKRSTITCTCLKTYL